MASKTWRWRHLAQQLTKYLRKKAYQRGILISRANRGDTRSFEPDAADVARFVEASLEFHRYGLRSFPFLKAALGV